MTAVGGQGHQTLQVRITTAIRVRRAQADGCQPAHRGRRRELPRPGTARSSGRRIRARKAEAGPRTPLFWCARVPRSRGVLLQPGSTTIFPSPGDSGEGTPVSQNRRQPRKELDGRTVPDADTASDPAARDPGPSDSATSAGAFSRRAMLRAGAGGAITLGFYGAIS